MAGKSAHGTLRLAEILSSLEVFGPKGTGLMVQKSITPGCRAMAGPTDIHVVSGPKDKAMANSFPPGQRSQTQRDILSGHYRGVRAGQRDQDTEKAAIRTGGCLSESNKSKEVEP